MPRAILGLIDVISIDCRLGVVAPPPLLPPQPLKASSPNRSAAPVDFDTTNELRDERVKKLPIMSHSRCGLRLVSFLRRESLPAHCIRSLSFLRRRDPDIGTARLDGLDWGKRCT